MVGLDFKVVVRSQPKFRKDIFEIGLLLVFKITEKVCNILVQIGGVTQNFFRVFASRSFSACSTNTKGKL
jgi:predicted unusual protein kinase regulating ubiquinone biosynthesis (AarF/ABC1/UbiB family)